MSKSIGARPTERATLRYLFPRMSLSGSVERFSKERTFSLLPVYRVLAARRRCLRLRRGRLMPGVWLGLSKSDPDRFDGRVKNALRFFSNEAA